MRCQGDGARVEVLTATGFELRQELLRRTDRIVGLEVELQNAGATVAAQEVALRTAAERARRLAAQVEELRARIAAIRASTTFRIGAHIVGPARRIAGLRRPR